VRSRIWIACRVKAQTREECKGLFCWDVVLCGEVAVLRFAGGDG